MYRKKYMGACRQICEIEVRKPPEERAPIPVVPNEESLDCSQNLARIRILLNESDKDESQERGTPSQDVTNMDSTRQENSMPSEVLV